MHAHAYPDGLIRVLGPGRGGDVTLILGEGRAFVQALKLACELAYFRVRKRFGIGDVKGNA